MPSIRKHREVAVVALVIALVAVVVVLVISPGAALLFILAIAPSAFLLWHFYNADKYKHESKRLLGGTFLLGALSVIPAVIIEGIFKEPSADAGVLAVFVYFLFGVGLIEELMKFLSVRIYPYRSKHFDEPMDGIVFGVAAALGFATIENLLFVSQSGIGNALVRAIVSVPGHAFWGAIIGFYLGEAKVRGRSSLALKGLVFAVLLHGLFDTLTTVVPNAIIALVLVGALVWILYFKVVKKEIAEAEAESPHGNHPEPLTSPAERPITRQGFSFCPECGVPVEPGAKFCINCGRPLT